LREKGYEIGLVKEEDYRIFREKKGAIERTLSRITETTITRQMSAYGEILNQWGTSPVKKESVIAWSF